MTDLAFEPCGKNVAAPDRDGWKCQECGEFFSHCQMVTGQASCPKKKTDA